MTKARDIIVFVAVAAILCGCTALARRGELRIEGVENIAALEAGGAVWWEPDGSYVALQIVEPAPR